MLSCSHEQTLAIVGCVVRAHLQQMQPSGTLFLGQPAETATLEDLMGNWYTSV